MFVQTAATIAPLSARLPKEKQEVSSCSRVPSIYCDTTLRITHGACGFLLIPPSPPRKRGVTGGMTRFVVRGSHARLTRGRPYTKTKRRQTFFQSPATFVFRHSWKSGSVLPAKAGIQKAVHFCLPVRFRTQTGGPSFGLWAKSTMGVCCRKVKLENPPPLSSACGGREGENSCAEAPQSK